MKQESYASEGRRLDVEGLRAVAIILVLLFHSELSLFSRGFVGVDIFFVISGFVITRLLYREIQKTGTLDAFNFYGRRVKRLLPAACLVLTVTALCTAVFSRPSVRSDDLQQIALASGYGLNIYFAVTGEEYMKEGEADRTLAVVHFWSLNVEEQMYFVWPWVLLLGLRMPSRVCTAFFSVLGGVSFLACVFVAAGQHHPWAFFAPWFRGWQFLLGALCVPLEARIEDGLARAYASVECAHCTNGTMHAVVLRQFQCCCLVIGSLCLLGSLFVRTECWPNAQALVPSVGVALTIVALTNPPRGLDKGDCCAVGYETEGFGRGRQADPVRGLEHEETEAEGVCGGETGKSCGPCLSSSASFPPLESSARMEDSSEKEAEEREREKRRTGLKGMGGGGGVMDVSSSASAFSSRPSSSHRSQAKEKEKEKGSISSGVSTEDEGGEAEWSGWSAKELPDGHNPLCYLKDNERGGARVLSSFASLLSSPFLVWLGGLSYSVYLWHWPVIVLIKRLHSNYKGSLWGGMEDIPLPFLLLGGCLLSFLPALISLKCVETPLRKAPHPGGRPFWSLFWGCVFSFGLAGLFWLGSTSGAPQILESLQASWAGRRGARVWQRVDMSVVNWAAPGRGEGSRVIPCGAEACGEPVVGRVCSLFASGVRHAQHSRKRQRLELHLFGDSHMQNFNFNFRAWAEEQAPNVRILATEKKACRYSDAPVMAHCGYDGEVVPCTMWREKVLEEVFGVEPRKLHEHPRELSLLSLHSQPSKEKVKEKLKQLQQNHHHALLPYDGRLLPRDPTQTEQIDARRILQPLDGSSPEPDVNRAETNGRTEEHEGEHQQHHDHRRRKRRRRRVVVLSEAWTWGEETIDPLTGERVEGTDRAEEIVREGRERTVSRLLAAGNDVLLLRSTPRGYVMSALCLVDFGGQSGQCGEKFVSEDLGRLVNREVGREREGPKDSFARREGEGESPFGPSSLLAENRTEGRLQVCDFNDFFCDDHEGTSRQHEDEERGRRITRELKRNFELEEQETPSPSEGQGGGGAFLSLSAGTQAGRGVFSFSSVSSASMGARTSRRCNAAVRHADGLPLLYDSDHFSFGFSTSRGWKTFFVERLEFCLGNLGVSEADLRGPPPKDHRVKAVVERGPGGSIHRAAARLYHLRFTQEEEMRVKTS